MLENHDKLKGTKEEEEDKIGIYMSDIEEGVYTDEYYEKLSEAYQDELNYEMDEEVGKDILRSENLDSLIDKIFKEVTDLVEGVISETDDCMIGLKKMEMGYNKESGFSERDRRTVKRLGNRIIQNNGIVKYYRNFVKNTVDILTDVDNTKDKKLEKLENNVYNIAILLNQRGKICNLHNLYGELEEEIFGETTKSVEITGK